MNREQLKNRIEALPLFEKRKIQIRTSAEPGEEYEDGFHKAICEVGDKTSHAYAFVGKNYALLQFNQVFSPILDSIEGDVDGYISHFGGFAMMKFFPEDENLIEGENRFGLIAMNSVDMTSSVIVKFCVENDKRQITIPPKVAGLKKQHSGSVGNITKDYISMIGKVKSAWSKIINEFPKYVVVRDLENTNKENAVELGVVLKQLKAGQRIGKEVDEAFKAAEKNGVEYTLWDAFVRIHDLVSSKTYKSPVHKEKKIDTICQAVFDYALMLSL